MSVTQGMLTARNNRTHPDQTDHLSVRREAGDVFPGLPGYPPTIMVAAVV